MRGHKTTRASSREVDDKKSQRNNTKKKKKSEIKMAKHGSVGEFFYRKTTTGHICRVTSELFCSK